ncbi:MAG: LytTR family DNA-binding domain-containing protein [Xanthomarina sp.]
MIAEDEYLAKDELIYMLEKEKDVELCPSAESGEELIELYFEHKPDILILDIEMPGMTGVDAARQILKTTKTPPFIVFTTAYDSYAVEAFDLEAVDYLLKPFDQIRFQQMMERLRNRQTVVIETVEPKQIDVDNSSIKKLLIDDGEKMIVISPSTIYYAVPSDRMLEIYTEDKVIESKLTLQELERKLSGLPFFRTHRSYLVNLNQILEITPWFNGAYNITLKDENKTTIPVSRSARKGLFEKFGN